MISRIPLFSQNFTLGDALQVVMDRWTEPITGANNFQAKLWTAEGLGGASRINGMVFTRGTPAEYNAWAEEFGLDDWAWDKVEPYFRRTETSIAHPDSPNRGHDGPIELRKFKTEFEWGP
jgi:choline dehydrogenase-like flavoprotein